MLTPSTQKSLTLTAAGAVFVFFVLYLAAPAVFEYASWKWYDYLVRNYFSDPVSSEIVLVDIDQPAVDRLGELPWPPSLIADCIEALSAGRPKTIGIDSAMVAAPTSLSRSEIEALRKRMADRLPYMPFPASPRYLESVFNALSTPDDRLNQTLAAAQNTVIGTPLDPMSGDDIVPPSLHPRPVPGGRRRSAIRQPSH